MLTMVSGEFTVIEVGVMLVIAGTGKLATVKLTAAEVPPPGVPVTTVIGIVAGFAISIGAIPIVNFVELTKVVARLIPATWTTEVGTNPVPVTTRVNAGPPAGTALGDKELITGRGLMTGKLTAELAPPPGAGFETPISALPTAATSAGKRLV